MSAGRATSWGMLASAILFALAGHACSTPGKNERSIVHPPESTSFAIVGVMLDRRCGTLDCHGSHERNLRLFGQSGLRLEAPDLPGYDPTTTAELAENYRSVVSLEPEILDTVLREGGAHPERLTLVRKARSTEDHLGGTLFDIGDDGDVCLTSWLSGKVDEATCIRARDAIDPLIDQLPMSSH